MTRKRNKKNKRTRTYVTSTNFLVSCCCSCCCLLSPWSDSSWSVLLKLLVDGAVLVLLCASCKIRVSNFLFCEVRPFVEISESNSSEVISTNSAPSTLQALKSSVKTLRFASSRNLQTSSTVKVFISILIFSSNNSFFSSFSRDLFIPPTVQYLVEKNIPLWYLYGTGTW